MSDQDTPQPEPAYRQRTAITRIYPGLRVHLAKAWSANGEHFPAGAAGHVRGLGRDLRPQVEFDSAPGHSVSVDENILRTS